MSRFLTTVLIVWVYMRQIYRRGKPSHELVQQMLEAARIYQHQLRTLNDAELAEYLEVARLETENDAWICVLDFIARSPEWVKEREAAWLKQGA